MTTVWRQGADGVITGGCQSPGLPASVPSDGWISMDDSSAAYQAYLPGQAEAAAAEAQAAAFISALALNGTYPLDPQTQANIIGVATAISVFGKLPDGSTSGFTFADGSGGFDAFPSTAEWVALVAAVASYVNAIEHGQTPSHPATIP